MKYLGYCLFYVIFICVTPFIFLWVFLAKKLTPKKYNEYANEFERIVKG